MKHLWDRWGLLSWLLSVACLVVGTMMVLSQPQDKDSDAKIVAYFTDHSHRVKGMVGFFVFLAGILLLLMFLAALRDRLAAAEGRAGGATALVFGAGLVSVSLTATSMLLANGTLLAVTNTSKFQVEPNTFRLFADTAYATWVSGVMVAAFVVWGASAVALRTGLLPAWWGRLGIAIGVAQLFAFLFFPFFAWLIWIVGTSLLLTIRGATAPARIAQPAV
jgi:hypothetical protein